MALRLLRLLNHWFSLMVFWGYLAAFALAFTMVVVFFPVGALVLLFAGILSLPIVMFVSMSLGALERAWSRRWLRSARCPSCGADETIEAWQRPHSAESAGNADDLSWRNEDAPPSYECRRCGAFFAASGEGVEAPLGAT